MRHLIVPLFIVFLVGCGSTSNIMSYRPKGSTAAAWNVRAEKGHISNNIQIFINDSLVCENSPGIFSSDVEAKGDYHGHPVMAMIQRTSSLFSTGIRCMVFIDGELAGKFEF